MSCEEDKSAPKQRIFELEKALVDSEENFRTLADFAPVGIYLNDAQGKAIYINQKCADLVGVPAEDALNFNWIPFLHPDDREKVISTWEKAFQSSSRFHLEYRYVHSDGKVVWTLGDIVPIFGKDGKANLFIGTLTDITDRKRAEEEKDKLNDQLIQALKMESIGRLAGGVAHDYNNMLCVILSYTKLAIKEVDPSGKLHHKLQEILKATERSAEVTRQLLNFARKQDISPIEFDLDEPLNDMLNMLRRLIGQDIELAYLPQLGEKMIYMDPSQFDQVVVNLCLNARDAIAGTGKIIIKTSKVEISEDDCLMHPEYKQGQFVLLSISDNGCGMSKETLDNIFEPFFTTKDKNRGTGLGLSSVYGTVKQNNGFIDVQSEIGSGTTFNVYLPASQS